MTREEAKRYWEVFLIEIEELKQTYSDIDWEEQEQATKIAIADIQKQIPKKPTSVIKRPNGKYGNCPICNHAILKENYCPRCGQALDWSEENDNRKDD